MLSRKSAVICSSCCYFNHIDSRRWPRMSAASFHSPRYTGLRLSLNAVRPSMRSFVGMTYKWSKHKKKLSHFLNYSFTLYINLCCILKPPLPGLTCRSPKSNTSWVESQKPLHTQWQYDTDVQSCNTKQQRNASCHDHVTIVHAPHIDG